LQFTLPAVVDEGVTFFYPLTTTLAESRINRRYCWSGSTTSSVYLQGIATRRFVVIPELSDRR
jgi:hypothetical protein